MRMHSERTVAVMMSAVASGEADVAMMWFVDVERPEVPGVIVEELHSEPVVIMLPPGHRLVGAGSVGMGELRDERWLLMPMERDMITALAEPHGYVPRCDVAIDNPTLLRPLLLAGEGVAPLTRSEAPYHHPAPFVPLVPSVNAAVGIAYRRGHRSTGTRAVRDFFRQAVADADATAAATDPVGA